MLSTSISPNHLIRGLVFFLEVFMIIYVIIMLVWIQNDLNGFSWTKSGETTLNFHIILMPLALVFLVGNGIVIYRVFRNYPAKKIKYVHFGIQTCALVFMVIGGISAMQSRRTSDPERQHFYSLHSWLGLIVITLFCMQYLGGVMMFLFKISTQRNREFFAAAHAFFGIFSCILAGMVATLGIDQKLKAEIAHYEELPQAAAFVNIAGLVIPLFVAVVLYIDVNPYFEWDLTTMSKPNPID